ncbi:hypothetical protein [Nonomuraea basaltis]|nr:hypothetical protein [Nonomuraea basaltis]
MRDDSLGRILDAAYATEPETIPLVNDEDARDYARRHLAPLLPSGGIN